MGDLLKNIPWDRLGEGAVITIITIVTIYFIFKKYIDHENKIIKERVSKVESETKIELAKIEQEITKVKKNIVKNSDINILNGTQMEENNISGSTIKVG